MINYFLVLEKRLGDYNIIDINKLDIAKFYVSNDLMAIDSFTCNYNINEIKQSIIKNNIIQNEYINYTLKIISDKKHNLRVLTKDIYLLVRDFQTNKININKDLKNKLYNNYKKIIESNFNNKDVINKLLNEFKEYIDNNDKNKLFKLMEELPYNKIRNLYFIIYDELFKYENR